MMLDDVSRACCAVTFCSPTPIKSRIYKTGIEGWGTATISLAYLQIDSIGCFRTLQQHATKLTCFVAFTSQSLKLDVTMLSLV